VAEFWNLTAVECAQPPLDLGQAAAPGRGGAAAAVVGDLDPQHAAGVPDPDLGRAGAGVLDRVGERLGDREVAPGLDRRVELSGQDDVGLGTQRRV
jgi:hypothetical protein